MSSDKDSSPMKDDTADDMQEETVEPAAFGPAALGLHRVGTKLPPKPAPIQPIQVLNARGMPARIRKKNKLFFDDDIVNDKPPRSSPKRPLKPSPTKTPSKVLKKRKVQSKYMKMGREDGTKEERSPSPVKQNSTQFSPTIDRKTVQKIGLRLRNLLKLPKAHKFVSYEWFYSNIDRALFDGPSDFQMCLRETLPLLRTRWLTRVEWTKVRRMMGKPRRCSLAFFEDERRELERKRQKIRLLQNRKLTGDLAFVRDLPPEIPLPLSVGTKVTARLRQPQDGLFMGTIDAVESQLSSYRITFDRVGLGTQSVPDYEVLANETVETIPLSTLARELRIRNNVVANSVVQSPNRRAANAGRGDPLLGADIFNTSRNQMIVLPRDTVGGFPLKLLENVIRTRKSLTAKQNKLLRMREMNAEAELIKSYGESLPDDFRRRYAGLIISMEKLNRDMQNYLNQVQQASMSMAKEPNAAAMLVPSYLREKCRELGMETVEKNNAGTITNDSLLRLIGDLAMIMWVASNLATATDQTTTIMRILDGCMEEMKTKLNAQNIDVFQKSVAVHMHQIRELLPLTGA